MWDQIALVPRVASQQKQLFANGKHLSGAYHKTDSISETDII